MTFDEPQKRIEVVGTQYDIEKTAAQADKAAMVFFVPTAKLTPLMINPDDVYQDKADGLFKLKTGAKLPAGLMPAEKANDPAQLSTVLARVTSLDALRKKGVRLAIFAKSANREQVGNPGVEVDVSQNALLKKYEKNTVIYILGESLYKVFEKNVASASYMWTIGGKTEMATVSATQINAPNVTNNFGIATGPAAAPQIKNVNALLQRHGGLTLDQVLQNYSPDHPERARANKKMLELNSQPSKASYGNFVLD